MIFVLITLPVFVFGQAKKPSLMVVPSDLWCNQNGYMMEEYSMGEMVPVPDYRRALISNTDLLPVISRINGLMADRGFPLKNLESEIKAINSNSAETAAITSKDGATVKTSALEQLRQRAKADIIVQLTWTVNQTGPKRSVTYTLQGLDSYTNKEIALPLVQASRHSRRSFLSCWPRRSAATWTSSVTGSRTILKTFSRTAGRSP